MASYTVFVREALEGKKCPQCGAGEDSLQVRGLGSEITYVDKEYNVVETTGELEFEVVDGVGRCGGCGWEDALDLLVPACRQAGLPRI